VGPEDIGTPDARVSGERLSRFEREIKDIDTAHDVMLPITPRDVFL
jgi:hypothetical protein